MKKLIENARERKIERKKTGRKIKNLFKINRLFLHVSTNCFNLFLFIYIKII